MRAYRCAERAILFRRVFAVNKERIVAANEYLFLERYRREIAASVS